MGIATVIPQVSIFHAQQALPFLLSVLLKKSNVKVGIRDWEQTFLEQPYLPDILSVSDVLYGLEISHHAYVSSIDKLKDLAKPVLVYLNTKGGIFGVAEPCRGKIKITIEKGKTCYFTIKEFVAVWDGVVLELDVPDAGKSANKSILRKQKASTYSIYLIFVITLFIVLCLYQRNISGWAPFRVVLFLLNSAGLAVCWLLALQHLSKNNVLTRRLCHSTTEKGCGSALSNKVKILGFRLNMTDAGIAFFSGTVCLLLFFSKSAILLYSALLATIFSFYALYIQAVVIRKWCRLCIAVHITVVVNALLAVGMYMIQKPQLLLFPALSEILIFMLPSIVWLTIKPLLKKQEEVGYYKREYERLKTYPELFKALLKEQPKVQIPEELKVFSVGNARAANELVMISNPYCKPCESAHATIEKWLKQGICFNITFIFVHQSDRNDKKRQFVQYIAGVQDKERLRTVLRSWFKGGKQFIEDWVEYNFLVTRALPYKEDKLHHWLQTAGIEATPSFFVNGRKLPETYSLKDIKSLMSRLS